MNVADFAGELGPAFNDLRPFARNLDEAQRLDWRARRTATPVIRDEIRPFVRAAREPVPDLRRAADDYSKAAPRLTVVGKKLNRLGNMAAYNPRGAEPAGTADRDEGYLYWAAWLGHNGNMRLRTAGRQRPLSAGSTSPPAASSCCRSSPAAPAGARAAAAGRRCGEVPAGAGTRHRTGVGTLFAPAERARHDPSKGRGLMQKQAPIIGRILIAVGFALSCFGLILFLWIAFGGPVPLKPKSYRITRLLPRGDAARRRVRRADRRRLRRQGQGARAGAGLRHASTGNDTTEAVLEIEPEFAPISSDAKAILRQKTLLGETYVELTSGTEPGEPAAPVALGAAASISDAEAEEIESIPEGGTLGIAQTRNATQIDEIFNALDTETRTAFQHWQQTPPSRSRAAASTSTTRSATSARSSPTPTTCSRS